ncbi:MAG: MarR family transcriptional regulator [Synergistaceae bacterium]|nr:MarR family transcriptional regulator [Synergistaceae bacterium]
MQDLALEDLFVGAPVSEKEPVFEGKPVFISGEELFEKEPVAEVPIAEDPIEEGDIGAEEVIEEKFFDDEPLNNEENEEKNEPEAEKFEIEGASGLEFEPDSSTKPIPDAAQALEPIPPEGDYAATEFASIQAMVSLKGFAPLGMLFVLMDVLGGGEEGLIRVNRLANALKIGKPAMLTQLKNLEAAGLIRTVSSSQRGRHIELLAPNLMAGKKLRNTTGDDLSQPPLVLNVLPEDAPKNFSLEKLKALHSYLTNRGIRVVSLPDESKLDPRLAQIAAYLGKYLAYVQPFYTRLKATLDSAEEIHFSLQGFQGRDVTHTLNFCKMLKDIGFLAAFTYRRAPHYKIVARLNRLPTAINFLSGGWLEHYIRDRVIAILTTHPSTMETPFAFMKNPKIILPGDEDFEFDFLLIVADTVFWIEAKTGEYMDYLTKYARVSKLLGLNRNSNLLVLVDTPKPDVNISARYGLSCCNVDEFAEVFRLALVRELGRSGHS